MEMSLDVDGSGRFHLGYTGKAYSISKTAYVPESEAYIFDGRFAHTFISLGASVPFGNAYVNQPGAHPMAKSVRSLPVMMLYRPFNDEMGVFAAAKLELTTEQGVVDGRSCIVLRQTDEGGYTRFVWADPKRNYVPVRYFSGPKGTTTIQVDLSYAEDAKWGWVPKSWNVSVMSGNGKIAESLAANSVECVLNEPIPDDAFRLVYPPETWVHDYASKEEYILLGNGKRRTVLRGEFNGRNFNELLHSEPGSLAATTNRDSKPALRRESHSTLIVVLLSTVLVVCVALLAWRRTAKHVGTH